ncbi:hypothetical protein H4R19_006283, partial [Coemansia spiralis]
RTTLLELRVACEPLAHLWEAASVDSAPAERAAMREVFRELSDAVAGASLRTDGDTGGGGGGGVVRASAELEVERAAVAISVDSERFCTVYEPTPLAVRVRLVGGGGERRVWVTLVPQDPGEWLVAGATSQRVVLRGSAEAQLEFVLVPLEVGFLQPPAIICHDPAGPDDPQRRSGMHDGDAIRHLPTLATATHRTLCALANSRVATVYAVAPDTAPDSTALPA